MSKTSRISITDGPVREHVGVVVGAYRTKAARDKAVKDFLAPRSRRNSARAPKGKEPSNPEHRMYLQNEEYLDEHGNGRNIVKKGYGKTDETP